MKPKYVFKTPYRGKTCSLYKNTELKVIIMRVAIFDFDGTLYAQETFPLLMDHLKNHPNYHKKYRKFFRKVLPIYSAYKLRLYPEGKMKERLMQIYLSVLDDLSEDELRLYFKEIAEKMKKDFNLSVVSRLENHVADHVYTMIVSGAYTLLLDAATNTFKFNQTIGTDIPFHKKRIDQTVPLFHIQGMRKNVKILDALKGKKIDWENSFAYGDSYSDLPVLELVGNPVAVQPDPQLKTIAQERQWEIM